MSTERTSFQKAGDAFRDLMEELRYIETLFEDDAEPEEILDALSSQNGAIEPILKHIKDGMEEDD